MGKVSTLIHFPLEPDCEDYISLDEAVEDFEHDLDSILTDSVDTPEQEASLDEVDAISFQSLWAFSTWLVLFLILT